MRFASAARSFPLSDPYSHTIKEKRSQTDVHTLRSMRKRAELERMQTHRGAAYVERDMGFS